MAKRSKRTPEEKRIAQCEAQRRYIERSEENHQKSLASTRSWRARNKAEILAREKAARTTPEFKEKSRQYEKARYAADPEKGRTRSREWRLKNPELAKKSQREHHKKHAEKRKAQARKWREDHPEQVKANERAWRKANAEKSRLYGHNRRAIMRGSGGKVTEAEIKALWEKQGGLCAYFSVCGNPLKETGKYAAQRDHIQPLKPKDPNQPPGRNEISNIQLLCGFCNRKKKNDDPYRFTQVHEGRLFPDLPRKAKA